VRGIRVIFNKVLILMDRYAYSLFPILLDKQLSGKTNTIPILMHQMQICLLSLISGT
jgi:hypothetical protein